MRRAGPLLLMALTGLASGVVVARLPPDVETSVVTRRHHGADPLLSAVLLRFGVSSLLHHPARYFQPPFLFPDPNPLRGTEPLVAEALLALPFRLALGDRPAMVYTSVKIATLALVAFATGLLLRELGVRLGLCLLAAGLSVMVATTTVFADRLQALSLQWLPLALYSAIRFWRGGRILSAVAFGICLFLTVQASLYTAVMLLGLLPFLLPLLRPLLLAPAARRRLPALAAATAVAGGLCLLVLWPYVADRADVAAYSTSAYASEKSWSAAGLGDPLTSPPEYGLPGWRLAPAASWDGVYPGTAFVLLFVCLAALTLVDVARARARGVPTASDSPRRGTKLLLGLLLLALAGALAVSLATGATGTTRALAGVALWGAVGAWCGRLLRWPVPADDSSLLRLFASAAGLAAFVLFVMSLGSPVRLHYYSEPLAEGLFGPLSTVLSPLREMRELKRYLLPAGWAAVVAATAALELRLRAWPRALGVALAATLLAISLSERLDADTRKAMAPAVPAQYELLSRSRLSGGLLELPFDEWGRIASIHRMLWQPSHGRPIVAGKTGLDPAWYAPAFHVLNGFPSDESLALLRAWGIDSVLDTRGGSEPAWPEGVELRGRAAGHSGEWRLEDVRARGDVHALAEPTVSEGAWERAELPGPGATPGGSVDASPALDGSLDTAADVEGADGLHVLVPAGRTALAVELDLGSGRFGRVPERLRVLGRAGEEWLDMTDAPTGDYLRARAADQLLRQRHARLVIRLRPGAARELRLVADDAWDLPELRLRLVAQVR